MNSPKIIGILLVKDEDRFIEPVIKNIFEFCDKIIVADNYSRDQTYTIARHFAKKNSKLKVYRVSHPKESHKLIEHYAGTNTWIFGVDGDEIYDPSGLAEMKARLHSGTLRFKANHVEPPKLHLYKTLDWDISYFRCLHAVFMQRSSLNSNLMRRSRLNPAELLSIRSAYD